MSSFDERARTWDDEPARLERARAIAARIAKEVPLDASTRMLEYGAGTGLVSQELAEHVGAVTLADPSSGMREVMTEKVEAGVLPADARIWDLDLTVDPPPDERFDLVVTVMALHHVSELAPALRGFADLLSEGGRLCVVDLDEEGGDFHRDHEDFDGHDGFVHEDLADQLREAGFADVRFEPCADIEREGRTFPLFLAVATVPSG